MITPVGVAPKFNIPHSMSFLDLYQTAQRQRLAGLVRECLLIFMTANACRVREVSASAAALDRIARTHACRTVRFDQEWPVVGMRRVAGFECLLRRCGMTVE